MAIQGIIKGFGNPANLNENVFLLGHGSHYHLYHNGLPVEGGTFDDLLAASPAFDAKAKQVCAPAWLEVRGLVGNNVNSHYQVDALGSGPYALYSFYVGVNGGIIQPLSVAQALSREQAVPEMFPGATPDEVGFVYLQDILGAYPDINHVPERAWLEQHACFANPRATFEMVLRMDDDLSGAPESLRAVLEEAHEKVFVYVIISHRQENTGFQTPANN